MLAIRTLARTRLAAPTALGSRSRITPSRNVSSTAWRSADYIAPAPGTRKPIGAFRGGIFGFLFGSLFSGSAIYYYILQEYRVSNELLTEDIYALQAAVQRIEAYTKGLEQQVARLQNKKTL